MAGNFCDCFSVADFDQRQSKSENEKETYVVWQAGGRVYLSYTSRQHIYGMEIEKQNTEKKSGR